MKTAPRIAVVVGTRAQLIKVAPVMRLLEQRGIPYWFVFTAQHRETIDAIRANFGIKAPDCTLAAGPSEAKTIRLFGGWAWRAFWALWFRRRALIPFRGGIVLNHGDTATCLWGTLLARLTGNQALHLESGLRSFHLFKPFPEELIRLLTFALTTVYACPNEWARQNLRRYRGIKLNTELNTLYDSVQLALAGGATAALPASPYVVASIHRFENIFDPAAFRRVLDRLEQIAATRDVVFVEHPATARQLDRLGLRSRLALNPRITVAPRRDFFEFIQLVAHAEFVVTDGGSNQEELSYLGKPTLIMRQATERREGLGETAVLSEFDPARIDDFCAHYAQYRRPPLVAAQAPSAIVVDWLVAQGFAAPAEGNITLRPAFWRTASLLILFGLVAGYIGRHAAELREHLQHFMPEYVPGLMAVALASIVLNGQIMNRLVRQFGVRLRPWEWIGLAAAGSLGSYLPVPQAGAIVRGLYLKRVHQLPYDTFTATVLVTYAMMLPAIGILGLCGLAGMRFHGLAAPRPLWFLFAGLAASVALFSPLLGMMRPWRRLQRFQAGMATLLQHHILGRMALLQVAQLLLTTVALWLSFRALGAPLGWDGSLMLGLLSNAAGIANVTPGNLGVTESANALGAYFLGGNPQLAVVAYSVYRVASIGVLSAVSLGFLWRWRKRGHA